MSTDTTHDASAPEVVDDRAERAPDAGDPVTCGYCGRPFAREEWLVLHRGLDHEAELDESERAAFQAAYEDEEADLRMFRLQAIGVLILIYFSFLIVYGLVT
jgi:hypothetical protein